MTVTDKANAFALAKRKARYGHRDWLFWTDRAGLSHSAPKSRDTIKAAMLASGTQGSWTILAASTGIPHRGFWHMGIIMLRNARFGF